MSNTTGSFQKMKSTNKSAILNTVRLHGPISRAEVAKMTGLTPPTISNIVTELIESKLVIETELGVSTGGRKPIMLTINQQSYHVIGVYAGSNRIRAVRATLDGQIIYNAETKLAPQPSEEIFMQTIESTITELIEKDATPLLGIGVGVHGLVDPDRGISVFAPHLNLRMLPIKERLEATFEVPVEVENDVRAIALAESWFGQGQGLDNFICVNIGTGLGAGIVIDNQLYRGASYTAGEIGHATIDVNGPKCSCGNYGCLETFVSGPAIVNRMREEIRGGKSSLVSKLANGEMAKLTAEMVHQAAVMGDDLAEQILSDVARYLGIGISNLINTMNPSRIILSGGVSKAGDFILKPLQATVQQRALSVPAEAVSITISTLGSQATSIGAFALVLQKLYTPQGIDGFE